MSNASSNIIANVLNKTLRTKVSGKNNYTLSTTERWVYKKSEINIVSSLFNTSDKYLETNINLSTSNAISWICIKHTGKNIDGNDTSESIMVNFNTSTPIYSSPYNIIISPGELLTLKLNGVTISDLKCGSINYQDVNTSPSDGVDTIEAEVMGVVSV